MSELKRPPLELIGLHDHKERVGESDLLRWSGALHLLSECPIRCARPMLRHLGPRPYIFERSIKRWRDESFHLVDRDYQEWPGIVLPEEVLRDLGVHAWTRTRWQKLAFSEGCLPLMDDGFFYGGATKAGIHRLSHLLNEVVFELRRLRNAR